MFDEHQMKASKVIVGKAVVMSPAGSGKTKTAIERIKNLIELGINEEKILFITFSKKTSVEMKERLNELIGENKVYISTIHSLSFSLLKKIVNQRYQVVDDYMKMKIIKKIIIDNKIEIEGILPYSIMCINKIKNKYINDDEIIWKEIVNKPTRIETIKEIYFMYEDEKRNMSPVGIDFDDMMIKLLRILFFNEDTRRKVSYIFQYILVDEFQDTSYIQSEIIKILSEGHKNLYVIGDYNQSIYGFRNADPSYMINFSDHYGNVDHNLKLLYTYRCDSNIIDIANMLVDNKAESKTGKKGNVFYEIFADEFEEAYSISNMIKQHYLNTPVKILYRTNAYSMALELAMTLNEVPYKVVGQTQFFSRKEIKDICAYIDIIVNKPESLTDSWLRIINKPNRYLGKSFEQQLASVVNDYGDVILALKSGEFTHKYMNDNANKFALMLAYAPDTSTTKTIINFIYQKLGYFDYAIKQSDEIIEADTSPTEEILNEILLLADKQPDPIKFLKMIEIKGNDNAKCELMTIHKSKGLEAETVFVAGLCSGILPHQLSDNIEEENRLLYVAITRAKNNLYLTYPMMYNGKRRKPSEFIKKEILDKINQLKGE